VADNTILPVGTGGDTIRTISRAGIKTEVVQLDVGGEAGPESLVTTNNPLPVSFPLGVTVNNFPTTVTVNGSVAVSNLPAVQNVAIVNPQSLLLPTTLLVVRDDVQVDDDGITYVNPNVPGADIATGDKQTQILNALQQPLSRVVSGSVSISGPVQTSDTVLNLPPNAAAENTGQLQRIADLMEAVLLELRVLSATVQTLGQPVQDGLEQLREDLQIALN